MTTTAIRCLRCGIGTAVSLARPSTERIGSVVDDRLECTTPRCGWTDHPEARNLHPGDQVRIYGCIDVLVTAVDQHPQEHPSATLWVTLHYVSRAGIKGRWTLPATQRLPLIDYTEPF